MNQESRLLERALEHVIAGVQQGVETENSLLAFIRQSLWRRNADIHIEACSHPCHPYQPLYSYSPEFRQHKFESFACEFCTRNHNKV